MLLIETETSSTNILGILGHYHLAVQLLLYVYLYFIIDYGLENIPYKFESL